MINPLPLDIAPDPEPLSGAPLNVVAVLAVLAAAVLILVAVWIISKKRGGKK